MKTYFIIILLFCLTVAVYAQQDTSAYEVQRKKVNALLGNRSAKFGQYDESLIKRTGIFGLKTKKDMQRSIDILTEIVRTDNNIFKELKVLLDYKDLQQTQVKDRFEETQSRSVNFMAAINKLQDQNDKLDKQLKRSQKNTSLMVWALLIVIVTVSGAAYYLYRSKKLTFN